MKKPELELKVFASKASFEKWLLANFAKSPGLRIALAKKDSGLKSVTYVEAVEVALRFGWIDGQSGSLDERRWTQRFTPRRVKSKWSMINVGKAQKLIEAGLMAPSGLKEVERAKADGRWAAAYESPKNMAVPADFEKAISEGAKAKIGFDLISKSQRYSMLYRLHDAKRPETRAKRIEAFIKELEGTQK